MQAVDLRLLPPTERAQQVQAQLAALPATATAAFIDDQDPRDYAASGVFEWQAHAVAPGVWHALATHRGARWIGETVATLAERDPRMLPVFQRFGIDLCCGGRLTVAQAAAAHTIDVTMLLTALAEI